MQINNSGLDSNSGRLVQTPPTHDVGALERDFPGHFRNDFDLDDSQLLALVNAMEAELPPIPSTPLKQLCDVITSSSRDTLTARTEFSVSYSY